jgi:hypothetical protein
MALAKQVAADVRAGLAPREALLDFRELVIHPDFKAYLERLDPSLLRFLNLARKGLVSSTPLPHTPKGKHYTLFLPPLPGEAQLRVAYEVGLAGFLENLESKGYAVLDRGKIWVKIYDPEGPDLEDLGKKLQRIWEDYLSRALSSEALLSNLGALIVSVKRLGLSLSDSQKSGSGISLPDVPVSSEGTAFFLLAWCFEEGLVSESDLDQLSGQEKALVKGLAERLRLGASSSRFLLGRNNATSIKKKAKKLIERVTERNFDPWPRCVLSPDVFSLLLRKPGDAEGEICYGCGHILPRSGRSLRAYTVSKMVFSKPTNRRQSDYDGTDNKAKVCDLCATLSLFSPLKRVSGSVFVRLGGALVEEEAKAFARMVALGSLNVAAGHYIQLYSPTVRSGNKRVPLAQAVGRLIYALAYIGREVNPNVLRRLTVEVLEDGQSIPLPAPALWLSHLYQWGFGGKGARPIVTDLRERGEVNRDLAEALRYALAGLPWHGEYVLARRYGRVEDPVFLEAGRREYAALLAEGGEGMGKLAERFRDVAGLTGLLYAWADYIEQKAREKGLYPRREITKLLENLESPYFATYVASHTLSATQASLYRNPQQLFLYEEALRLLQEAGVLPREEEGRLLVSQDELWKAYAYLAEKYGSGDGGVAGKSWKDFIYEVRLALASRFPEYIRAEREG